MEGDICEGASAYITEEDALLTIPTTVKAIEDAKLHSGRMSKGTTDVAGGLRQQIPSCNPSHGRKEAQKETEIGGCENLYIGCSFDLKKSTVSESHNISSKRAKNLAGIHVVSTILEGEGLGKPMSFSNFDEAVERESKQEGFKSFKDMSGWPLNDFLIYNKDKFDLTKRKHRKFVKLRRKAKKGPQDTQDNTPPDTSTLEAINVKGWETVVNKSHTQSSVKSNGESSPQLRLKENIQETKSGPKTISAGELNKPDGDFKREESHENKQREDTSYSEYTHSQSIIEDFDQDQFLRIVSAGQTINSRFIDSVSVYESDPLLFSVDLVSLWNTPHSVMRHILIGVDLNKQLIGVEKAVDKYFFENIFLGSQFTMKPSFQVKKVSIDSKLFYVIDIASSRGHGIPCIVQNDNRSENVTIHKNDLWVRNGNHNVVCEQRSLDIGTIYEWFLKTTSSNSPRQSPLQPDHIRMPSKSPLRDSSTQSILCNEFDEFKTQEFQDEEKTSLTQSDFHNFWQEVNGFDKGHFALLTGDVCCSAKHISAFGLLPWLSVYDLDIFSSSSGLMSAVENTLSGKRHLKVFTWNDPAESISDRGTRWCFLRGRRELSSSRTDLQNDEIENHNIWFKQVKRGIDSNCEKLANFVEDYTVLTIVMLWPENEVLVPFMSKFLYRLNDTFSYTPNVVLLMNSMKPKTDSGQRRLATIEEDFANNIQVFHIEFETLCSAIQSSVLNKKRESVGLRLPCTEERNLEKCIRISEKDSAWLGEDIEVLHLETYDLTGKDVSKEVTDFYKGGTLPWCAWYTVSAQNAVVERNAEKDLIGKLQRHLDDYKTTTVTLFHAPGAGGTTLAHRVLWKLHTTYPCVHLKLRTSFQMEDLDRKILFLYEKTGMSVLLLVDGEEESKVRYLSRRLKYTVILYVKRYPYSFKTPVTLETDRVFLSGNVSYDESIELAKRFGEMCDEDNKITALDKLSRCVKKGEAHCMYEFGLTVYLHEFKGIVSYVSGYLQLHMNTTRELLPFQKCLGYLALVYFYGHCSVPCQFFAALFSKPPNFKMAIEDFPSPIQEFVVHDVNEGRKNNIRICQNIIAQEILEQILSFFTKGNLEETRTHTLTLTARKSLSKFCINFIEYTSQKKTKTVLSTTVMFILTKTFIFRDERDMGDNEEQVRRKPVLSNVMIDIPAGKPLFTERLNVLKKLVDSFPDNPNFHAHLGRFFAFCRQDEEHEAEKCFQTAVQLCDDLVSGRTYEKIDDGMKLTMMHIFHMYGIVKQRYVARYTGRAHKEKVVAFSEETIFIERLEEILPFAEEACEFFTKSRSITPESHDVYVYAYTGEIQVRLQICDFINKFQQGLGLVEFLSTTTNQRAKHFVQKSIPLIETLVLECYMEVDLLNADLESLRKNVAWYNMLFKRQALPLEMFASEDGVNDRRLKIASKKLKHCKTSTGILKGIDDVDDESDIEEIISLYEEIFSEIDNRGYRFEGDKKLLEREFREWIYAIRHEKFRKDYTLEEVLTQLTVWYENVRSPLAVFYMFILYSLLGFGTGTTPGKTECLLEALEFRETLVKMSHLVIRPKYPREWLGTSGKGIKRLKPSDRYVGISEDGGWSQCGRLSLAFCKGTICRPNTNSVNGMLALDLGVKTSDVKVYFIPKMVKLEGSRYAGERVEFNLAFTIKHGYGAFNVKLLKRHSCSNCSLNIEFTSVENTITCKCGSDVHKDEMNEYTG